MKIATVQQRFEINGIINQLLKAGEETFDPKIAERLRDIVAECDLQPPPKIIKTVVARSSLSQKFQAFAAGFGNISFNNSKKETVKTDRYDAILAGHWVISQRAMLQRTKATGVSERAIAIYIDRSFDEAREAEDRESYCLFYHPSGEPAYLSKAEIRTASDISLFGTRRIHLKYNFPIKNFKRSASMVPV